MSGTARSEKGTYCNIEIPIYVQVADAEINFEPLPHAVVPDAYAALDSEIQRTLTVLKMIFRETVTASFGAGSGSRSRFDEYFYKLGGIALAALGQDQPRLGRLALTGLQEEVMSREAGRVKNGYIRRLGGWALGFFAVTAFAYADCANLAGTATILHRFRDFFAMLAGSALGTWLSFSIRRVTLGFWDLATLEADLLDPPIRLAFVGGLTTVVGLMFATGFASIRIGAFNTASFLSSGTVATLIGCLCGIGEIGLSSAVAKRTSDFVGAIGGGGSPANDAAGKAAASTTADKDGDDAASASSARTRLDWTKPPPSATQ